MEIWRRYQQDIITGKIPASKYLIKQCKKLEQNLTDQNKKDFPYYFDNSVLPKILTIVKEMTHVRGDIAGQPIELEPWQKWLFANIYGWKRKANHIRRFKFVYLLTGKGNGKTVIDSIILALDLLFSKGGEAIVVASRKEQSDIAFQNIKSFIRNSDILASELRFTSFSIYNENKANSCKALSGRPEGINGKNLSVAVIDEIAEIKNFEVYNNTLSSCSKRNESLIIMSTTAQANTNSVGYEEWRKAQKILDGIIEDESYFPVLYQLDSEDDWTDSKNFIKANPNLDVSIRKEELERKLKNAVAGISSDEIQLRTLHLNQWVYDQTDMWIGPERWQNVIDNYDLYKEHLTEEKLKDYLCTGGIDLSLRNDLSVYTLVFWIEDLRKYYFKHKIYVPSEEIQNKMQSDSYLFYEWIKDGWVTSIDGPIIRNDIIVDDILQDAEKYKIKEIAYDKQYLDDESQDILSRKIDIIRMPQTAEFMAIPTSNFYNQSLVGSLIDNNPVENWCISNVEIQNTNYGPKVRKEYKSSSRRVDPVITSIMALSRLQQIIKDEEKRKRAGKMDWSKITY